MNKLKKIIILYLLLGILLMSKEYTKKELIEIVEKNEKFECVPDKKVIKFEGINFVGNLDENGKPYGEWKLKNNFIKQCFLDNEILGYEKGRYFSKSNEKMYMIISYENVNSNVNKNEISIQFFMYEKDGIKSYFLTKRNEKYEMGNKILTVTENIPLYNLVVIK